MSAILAKESCWRNIYEKNLKRFEFWLIVSGQFPTLPANTTTKAQPTRVKSAIIHLIIFKVLLIAKAY